MSIRESGDIKMDNDRIINDLMRILEMRFSDTLSFIRSRTGWSIISKEFGTGNSRNRSGQELVNKLNSKPNWLIKDNPYKGLEYENRPLGESIRGYALSENRYSYDYMRAKLQGIIAAGRLHLNSETLSRSPQLNMDEVKKIQVFLDLRSMLSEEYTKIINLMDRYIREMNTLADRKEAREKIVRENERKFNEERKRIAQEKERERKKKEDDDSVALHEKKRIKRELKKRTISKYDSKIIVVSYDELLKWTYRYIDSEYKWGRGPSFIELDCYENDEDGNLVKELIPRMILKGPDYFFHTAKSYIIRSTLLNLYPNLVRDLQRYINLSHAEWKEGVNKMFTGYADMGIGIEDELYAFMKSMSEYSTYEEKVKKLTDILVNVGVVNRQGNPAIYGKDETGVSCLGLFLDKGFERDEWEEQFSFIRDILEAHADGVRNIFLILDAGDLYNSYDRYVRVGDDVKLGAPALIPGDGPTSSKRLTYKKYGKTMIKRYFGDYLYQLDTSMYEDKGWVDNSSSGNLCGITSLVLNPKFKKELTKVGVDMSVEGVKRLIAECMLRSNIYKDSKLHRSSLAKIEEIHRYIARKLKDKIIFNVKYIRADINLRTDGKEDRARNEYLFVKKNMPKECIEFEVLLVEGHAFVVCDEEHREHLIKETIQSETNTRTLRKNNNVMEEVLVESIMSEYTQDRSKLFELIGDEELGRTICSKMRYMSYDDAVDYVDTYERVKELARKEYGDDSDDDDDDEMDEIDEILKGLNENAVEDMKKICPKISYLLSRCYGAFDVETTNDNNFKAEIYGISMGVFDDTHIIGNIVSTHNLDNTKTSKDLWTEMMVYYVSHMRSNNSNCMRLFAHNGGKFDTVLFLEELTKSKGKMGGLPFEIKTEIKSGGRIKYLNVEITDVMMVVNEKTGFEEEKKCMRRLEIVDSLVLLECSVADIEKKYGVKEASKGDCPHKFYQYAIRDLCKTKLEWSREELLKELEGFKDRGMTNYYEDLRDFLIEYKESRLNLVQLFEDYCRQDTKIMILGLIAANKTYSKIDLSILGRNVLGNKGRGFVILDSVKPKVFRISLLDSVTLSGLAKKICNYYVLNESGVSYSGVDAMYLSNYTGGLTYIKKVNRIVSSVMTQICTNKYFYVDPIPRNREIIKELHKNYGYNQRKQKCYYNAAKPPKEVEELRTLMRNTDESCVVLLDANSLYPSSIEEMKDHGGFPKGEFTKFDKNTRDYQKILDSVAPHERLWHGHFRVKWNLDKYVPGSMHPLIIQTENGNRHLTPEDTESKSIGMTNMMYKSIKECDIDIYELELINGVYWDDSSKAFCVLCKELYDKRNEYKKLLEEYKESGRFEDAAGMDSLQESIKKILNSLYGILLEKCHHIAEYYKNGSNRFEWKELVAYQEGEFKVKYDVTRLPTEKDLDELKNGLLAEYNKMNNFYKVERIDIKRLDEYESWVHMGSFVLDASKYLMNKLFSALNWDILYSDTDSAFFYNHQFNTLREKFPRLIGKNLGQFKVDFDDKMNKKLSNYDTLRDEFKSSLPKYVVGKDKYVCEGDFYYAPNKKHYFNLGRLGGGLVPEYGVVSILSIFTSKKVYYNLLLGVVNTEHGSYLTVAPQTTGKGLDTKSMTLSMYERLYNDETVVQDRGVNRATFRCGKGSVYIFDKGTKPFPISVTNCNVRAAKAKAKASK